MTTATPAVTSERDPRRPRAQDAARYSVDTPTLCVQLHGAFQTTTIQFHSFARLERAIAGLSEDQLLTPQAVIERFELEGGRTIQVTELPDTHLESDGVPASPPLGRAHRSTASASETPPLSPRASPRASPQRSVTPDSQRLALFALTIVCGVNAFALSLPAPSSANDGSSFVALALSAINLVAAIAGVVLHWRSGASQPQ